MNAMNSNNFNFLEHSSSSWSEHSFSEHSWCECWSECNSSNCNESIFVCGVLAQSYLKGVEAPETLGVINVKTTYLKPVLDLEATGTKIKTLMKQKGITPRQLQVVMDFPYVQTIYNWFRGLNMPTLDNLVVLAQVLGVQMDDIVVTRMVEMVIDDPEGVEILSA